MQIESDKAQSGFEELKARVGKLEKDLRKAEKERTAAQADVQELTARFNNTDTALGNAEREIEAILFMLKTFDFLFWEVPPPPSPLGFFLNFFLFSATSKRVQQLGKYGGHVASSVGGRGAAAH